MASEQTETDGADHRIVLLDSTLIHCCVFAPAKQFRARAIGTYFPFLSGKVQADHIDRIK